MLFSIDILQLMAQGHFSKWNAFLTDCLAKNDINRLARTRRELQEGMADVARRQLNSEKVNVFYCRLITSIEKTARRILKKVKPAASDDPAIAMVFGKQFREVKRQRDRELEKFLKDTSY